MSPYQYIIVSGNVSDGFVFYGPYATQDEAVEEAEAANLDGDWWIAKLWSNIND